MEYTYLYFLALLIPLMATLKVSSTYKKYQNEDNKKVISGFEVAKKILEENGLKDMYIVEVKGELTDHYDPKQKVVRLSSDVFHGETIASAAVAAHECGHAIQDKEQYNFMKIRAKIFPIVDFATYLAYLLFIVSLLFQIFDMLFIAVIILTLSLIFEIVTLPVEFDASKRALKYLKEYEILDKEECSDAKKVLNAAALTYVAAIISTLLNLIRVLFEIKGRRD